MVMVAFLRMDRIICGHSLISSSTRNDWTLVGRVVLLHVIVVWLVRNPDRMLANEVGGVSYIFIVVAN